MIIFFFICYLIAGVEINPTPAVYIETEYVNVIPEPVTIGSLEIYEEETISIEEIVTTESVVEEVTEEETTTVEIVTEEEITTVVEKVITNIKCNGVSYNSLDELNKNQISLDYVQNKIIENKDIYNDYINELLELINNSRDSKLILDDTLTNAAMHRAIESAYFDWNATAYENGIKHHIRPNLEKANTITAEYGIAGLFGENYGRYQMSPQEIFDGWWESESHRLLMTNTKYSKVGIGIAEDSEGYLYWITIYGG